PEWRYFPVRQYAQGGQVSAHDLQQDLMRRMNSPAPEVSGLPFEPNLPPVSGLPVQPAPEVSGLPFEPPRPTPLPTPVPNPKPAPKDPIVGDWGPGGGVAPFPVIPTPTPLPTPVPNDPIVGDWGPGGGVA